MQSKLTQNIIEKYRHGGCYPMAISLSKIFELPIKALVVDIPQTQYNEGYSHVVHAFISGNEDFDIGGKITESELQQEYLENSNRSFHNERFLTFQDSNEFIQYLIDIHTGHLKRFLKHDMDFITEELEKTDKIAKIFHEENEHLYSSNVHLKI